MQYRVEQGKTLDIALMDAEEGTSIEFDEVLMVSGTTTGETLVGDPVVQGAKVRANVIGSVKGDKIVVFRYRNKKRYRRRTGHRQKYTRVKVDEIIV
jgi:large subunit ribosomal protein L21